MQIDECRKAFEEWATDRTFTTSTDRDLSWLAWQEGWGHGYAQTGAAITKASLAAPPVQPVELAERDEKSFETVWTSKELLEQAHLLLTKGAGKSDALCAKLAKRIARHLLFSVPKRESSDVIKKLERQVYGLQNMANEARGYLLERPANKTKCNILLLRMTQMKLATDEMTDVERVKAALSGNDDQGRRGSDD